MSNQVRYECLDTFLARKIKSVAKKNRVVMMSGGGVLHFTDGSEPVKVSRDFVKQFNPVSGSYYVTKSDGKTMIIPASFIEGEFAFFTPAQKCETAKAIPVQEDEPSKGDPINVTFKDVKENFVLPENEVANGAIETLKSERSQSQAKPKKKAPAKKKSESKKK